jgi:hypothetical protein
MAQELDVGKFDRTAWVLMVCGVVAFIATFLPWATASAFGISVSFSAWSGIVGFSGWFPMILLLAVGVAAFLPGIGVRSIPELHLVAFGVSALAFIIVLIRWVTYPTGLGAGAGLIIGLLLAVAAGVAAYLTPATQAAVAKLRSQRQQPSQPPAPEPNQPPTRPFQ